MELPLICQKAPYEIELKPGVVYSWCSCGLSKTDPWCDGSHKIPEPTGFKSLKFEVEAEQKYLLCGCKRTNTPPYCDETFCRS